MSKILTRWMAGELKKQLAGLEGGVVVDFTGLNSAMTYSLRTEMRAANIKVTVVKNKIAEKALAELGFPEAGQVLKGPTAILHGGDGPPYVAKTILEWKKKHKAKAKALTVKGAFLPGHAIEQDRVEELSKAPGRPEAMAMVLGIFQTPARQIAVLSQLAAVQPLYLLKAFADKRGESNS